MIMTALLDKIARDKAGLAAVEYGLVVALVTLVIIFGVGLLGGNLNTVFSTFATSV